MKIKRYNLSIEEVETWVCEENFPQTNCQRSDCVMQYKKMCYVFACDSDSDMSDYGEWAQQEIEIEIKPRDIIKNRKQDDIQTIATTIGGMVSEKQAAYGDSYGKSGEILKILYPDGISPDQFTNALAIARVIDKLFRIATNKDTFGENPWSDIAGYGILGSRKDKL